MTKATLVSFQLASALMVGLCACVVVAWCLSLVIKSKDVSTAEGFTAIVTYAASGAIFGISFSSARGGDPHRACNLFMIGLFLNCVLVFSSKQLLGL